MVGIFQDPMALVSSEDIVTEKIKRKFVEICVQ